MRSYLDDPEHPWVIQEHADPTNREDSLNGMLATARGADEEGIRLILRGYAGLRALHPEAKDEDCLLTSLVWYFG